MLTGLGCPQHDLLHHPGRWRWCCSSGTGCRSASSRSPRRWRCGRPACSRSNQALAGFGDPVVIFIATLFVVSEALDATGVTTWAGQQLIERVGDSQTRLLVLTHAAGGRLLSALISPNGAVAALLPMVVVLAVRLGALAVAAAHAAGVRRPAPAPC